MKKNSYILILCIFIFGNTLGQKMNSSTYFENPNDAVRKATSDLIEILKSKRDLNLGINIEELQNAKPGAEIQNFDVSFDLLLKAENSTPISKMADKPKNYLYPLNSGNRIVCIIELRKEEKGWLIGGIASQTISSDLNTILRSLNNTEISRIKMYEVPNLNTNIYEVQVDNKALLYNDQFSLREPISQERLMSLLLKDATDFQREFGPQLKKEKLVK